MAPVREQGGLKQIFRRLTIAIAGDFGDGWSERQISGWITLRGGKYVQEMDSSVTHLVCTAEEYRARNPKVRRALRMGKKACRIVTKDWLEDCCQQEKLFRAVDDYLCSSAEVITKRKENRDAFLAKGFELAPHYVNTAIYHIYTDSTYFRYQVTISRDDEGSGIVGERYVLSLFESNAKPHLYWFAAKHYKSKQHTQASFYRPSSSCQLFSVEFSHFEGFFFKKTGVRWRDRLRQASGVPGRFRYVRPARGQPIGMIEGQSEQSVVDSEETVVARDPTPPVKERDPSMTTVGEASEDGEAAKSEDSDVVVDEEMQEGIHENTHIGIQGDENEIETENENEEQDYLEGDSSIGEGEKSDVHDGGMDP